MKIEICSPSNPAYSANIYADGKKVSAPKPSIMDSFGWSDDEIMALIGESNFEKYEQGKYQFNVTTSHFKLITRQRAASNNYELKLLDEYGIL